MRVYVILLVLLVATTSAEGYNIAELEAIVKNLNETIHNLTRQMMLDEFYSEERVRSNGCSGIKQVRHQRDGTRPYHTETHIGSGVASIHDHADSVATMGMGEFHVVLNGVEFRTRHNDYLLKMPSTRGEQYHVIQDVPFPPVPPSVLKERTVQGQIREMREYFKAFKEQNPKHRDYRPYFRPVLSYLEGAWTNVGKELEEPFPGERHWIQADTWEQLEDLAMYSARSGNKETLENLAYLPRVVINIDNDGKNGTKPVFAQWNYRILCHPLHHNLPLNRLNLVDDLATRLVTQTSFSEMRALREARFTLSPLDKEKWSHGRYVGTLLDKLMYEIPGKNNYGSHIFDKDFGYFAEDAFQGTMLKSSYYHHIFKTNSRDGMGMQVRHRGFSDETLFLARCSQPKVALTQMRFCTDIRRSNCKIYKGRFSYAIPMEIIYLTPLRNWNPYNITYYGWSAKEKARGVTRGGRDGSYNNPYNGTNSKHFFRTPAEFFSTKEVSVRPADTTRYDVYVLDATGQKRRVRASGHRIIIPNIENVGRVRQRYPIMPIHTEGTTVWKELAALKEIVLNPARYKNMMYGDEAVDSKPVRTTVTMAPADSKYGQHIHEVDITEQDLESMLTQSMVKTTSLANGHSHQLALRFIHFRSASFMLRIDACDDSYKCWDGHSTVFPQTFTRNGTVIDADRFIDFRLDPGNPMSYQDYKTRVEPQVSAASTYDAPVLLLLIAANLVLSL